MSSKMRVIFQLNTSQGSRIKQVAIHPIKQWVGIINDNNTFSLWNYTEKILIKSFSCNTLDDNKVIEIKEIVFYDRDCIQAHGRITSMKNNVIFITNSKLVFYNYVTDEIKQVSEKDLDQKVIRRVCVFSETKICIAMNDGSFKILDTEDSHSKGQFAIQKVKPYHSKPITWILTYSQNYNEMPGIITASDQDGMMACWNINSNISPNLQTLNPSFKFQPNKKFKQSGSDEILWLQYDPTSYRLVTMNNSLIRFWSTMTGFEVKRIKNTYRYKQICFFNHFSYASESFLAHGQSSKLYVTRPSEDSLVNSDEIELKNFFSYAYSQNPQQQFQVTQLYTVPHHPANIYIVTNLNMAIFEVDKFYSIPFGYHHSFITKFSTVNSKMLVNKAQGQIIKKLTWQQIKKVQIDEQILTNTFFLSFEQCHIYFNLIQIQYSTMLHQTRKYKLHTVDESSPLCQTSGSRSAILLNFEANQLIIFNRQLCYYQLYASYNQHESQDILGMSTQTPNRIDYYSKLRLVGSGYARDIGYHQYRHQFAVVVGVGQKGELVEWRVEKGKKGMFKSSKDAAEYKMSLSAQPKQFRTRLFQKDNKGVYNLAAQSPSYKSKSYHLFNFGSFFAYSVEKGTQDFLDFVTSDKNILKEMQGALVTPQQVYVSYCESQYICVYDKYFILFKAQQNGSMTYFRTFQHTILHGMFWQKLFFFLTPSALYFLQALPHDTITIKLADISPLSPIPDLIAALEDDDLEPITQTLPAGQYQILTIVNMHLVLLSQMGIPVLLNLEEFTYVVFCLQVASGAMQAGSELYARASRNIGRMMRDTLMNYGMIVPDLVN